MKQPDLATISNLLIAGGALLLAVAVAGIVGLLWCAAGGLFAGLLAAGAEAIVLGVAMGRAAPVEVDVAVVTAEAA